MFRRIEFRDLSARLQYTQLAQIHPQLVGGLAGLGEGFGADDCADANIESVELIECCMCHCAQFAHMHVVIIGAGWAGVAAAIHAVEHGARVTVIEERPYIGGRARSFPDRETNTVIDNGQHIMMGCYREVLHVLRTLGTDHQLDRQAALRVGFVDAGGKRDVLDASALPGKLGVALGILRLQQLPLKARLAAMRFALRLTLHRIDSSGMTCKELFARYRQPAELVSRLWEPIVLATMNASINDASADVFCTVMRLAFLGSTEDSQILVPRRGLSDLLEPFTDWLRAHGGSVHTSVAVERLTIAQDRVTSVVLSTGEEITNVDAVVSCVPQRALTRICAASQYPLVDLHEPAVSPIVSVYLWYSAQWMTTDLVAALGTATQWIFNKHQTTPGLVALTISAASDIAGQERDMIVAGCDAEVRQLFPEELNGVKLLHSQVIKEKAATPVFTPAANAERIASDALGIENLRIAGDWVQTGLPATLEGAAFSGVLATSDLLPA